jgi:hypothetical protein
MVATVSLPSHQVPLSWEPSLVGEAKLSSTWIAAPRFTPDRGILIEWDVRGIEPPAGFVIMRGNLT